MDGSVFRVRRFANFLCQCAAGIAPNGLSYGAEHELLLAGQPRGWHCFRRICGVWRSGHLDRILSCARLCRCPVGEFGISRCEAVGLAATLLGLTTLLHTSAIAFQTIKIAGVLFLLWMAWGIWRNQIAFTMEGQQDQVPWQKLIRNGMLVNLLNPKLSIFFLAFLPQFVPAGTANATGRMVVLGLVFMGMTLAVFMLYGAFAALARDHVIARPRVMRWVQTSFAAAFGLLALRLAFATR